ncbi:peptidoglycan/xylan/chitin deacetylase (PgdA/CDA1 family) [Motilibacter rhizosphaerae]|uniref:Peptidoglycan/xylan/chitin deacetylase (PgdA/CDA1 family) n=1 Tax=Motilibacter rhizosphaerae TaxID=598652 RepID=A0A4Q7NRN2_9ACTN|nr:polysaccharide deacetylase family protein [Motilibacter rhizosphaerae]RZS89574.1 peptidoglycan/xylan/chitin deacetylase (PgdA/CDA1 family) [Motilibacter rhizosphaerae]
MRTPWRRALALLVLPVLAACSGATHARPRTSPVLAPVTSAPAAVVHAAPVPRDPTVPPLGDAPVLGARGSGARGSRLVRAPRLPGLAGARGRLVTLTFDDGPSPEWTPQVLSLLAADHVHAVFCLIGREAAAHPDLVRAIVAGGNALCDHSRDHDLKMAEQPASYQAAEVEDGLADIRGADPQAGVRFYRQPGGLWTAPVLATVRARHLTPLSWDVDPVDWSEPGAAAVVQRVLHQLHPGAYVLMHDGGGDRSGTVAALRTLLPDLRARHFTVVLPPAA